MVLGRLKVEPNKTFRFMDGTIVTASQAAEEIENGTAKGEFFFKIEKRALELAEIALAKGEVG